MLITINFDNGRIAAYGKRSQKWNGNIFFDVIILPQYKELKL